MRPEADQTPALELKDVAEHLVVYPARIPVRETGENIAFAVTLDKRGDVKWTSAHINIDPDDTDHLAGLTRSATYTSSPPPEKSHIKSRNERKEQLKPPPLEERLSDGDVGEEKDGCGKTGYYGEQAVTRRGHVPIPPSLHCV